MVDALIGSTGFVGSTLLRQRSFAALFHTRNIDEIAGSEFDTVVCAGAPAQKWIANQQPERDRENISRLIDSLKKTRCRAMVLISTVDVFKNPVEVYEDTLVDELGLHPYGLNRRTLEKFVDSHFESCLIVRLPGLVGPGLRKNAIFDILNENNVQEIDGNAVYQFYPMTNLWYDVRKGINAGLRILHLTAAPISMARLADEAFGKDLDRLKPGPSVRYDMRTRHAELFDSQGCYQYSARETIQAVRAYAQTEPKTNKEASGR